jgi:uncharacterized protein (TIGR03790 family)
VIPQIHALGPIRTTTIFILPLSKHSSSKAIGINFNVHPWSFRKVFSWAILSLTLLGQILPQPTAFATLHPGQLVIVANENDPDSMDVARHYAKQRGVPLSHIVRMDLPLKETIRRTDYEKYLAEPLKAALVSKGLAATTRFIVTTYGVPLRITKPHQSEQEKAWQADANQWHNAAMEFLHTIASELLQTLQSLQKDSTSSPSAFPDYSESDQTKPHEILRRIDTQIAKFKTEIQKQPSSKIPNDLTNTFFKHVLQLDGLSAYSKYSPLGQRFTARVKVPLDQLQSQVQIAGQMLPLLTQNPSKKNRDWAYQLAQRFFGIRGVLHLATAEEEQFTHKDAAASVDSELSVLWLDPDEYSLNGRMPNPLYAWYQGARNRGQKNETMSFPVLMVSRIDAPTPELAKQMINKAMLAEQSGLSGKVYLDARGLKPKKALGYGDYDQSLRNIADFFKEKTSYPVILENTKKRFQHVGEAPQVGVYAGWYRLRHYEDAFTFNPGAIGYHMASGEAVSIHKPKEKGWCKNALQRGITVTIGPTSEPYLDAFPKPAEFFGLMLTGRYTLVEAYYLSTRHASWRMVLFGDPLYNPWKGVSLATLQGLQQSIPEFRTLHTLPLSPSDQLFPDPIQWAQTRRSQRDAILGRVPVLLNTNP